MSGNDVGDFVLLAVERASVPGRPHGWNAQLARHVPGLCRVRREMRWKQELTRRRIAEAIEAIGGSWKVRAA